MPVLMGVRPISSESNAPPCLFGGCDCHSITATLIRGEDLRSAEQTVAFASAVMRQSGSIVVDNRHARTLWLNLSMTATDVTGRCPSEDIGGHCGYAEFSKAVDAPKHECHAGLKEVGCRRPAH